MRLDENVNLFSKYLNETAVFLDVNIEYVEKDYWLSLILKNIVNNNSDYVFKGGTCLSKCYHLIKRFSEDIDISYKSNYNSLTASEKNRLFKGITRSIKNVGIDIYNKDHLRRSAFFNRFECPYKSIIDLGIVDKMVIIELAGQTPSFPSQKKSFQPFVGEYLEKINRHDLVELYQLGSFEVMTQSLSRTIVDKTFAICDYYLSKKTKKHSRHLYDIHKILTMQSLDDEVKNLFSQIREIRSSNPICYSAHGDVKLHDIIKRIIDEHTYKEDYNNVTFQLLYEQVKYEDCLKSLLLLYQFLLNNDI